MTAANISQSPAAVSRAAAILSARAVKILVVDDDSAVRKMIMHTIAPKRYKVLEASNGYQGYGVAVRENPSLIILDIDMPGMNGIKTLQRIKAHPIIRKIPVIIMTGLSTQENVVDAVRMGAADVFTKDGFSPTAFLARVIKALAIQDQDKPPIPANKSRGGDKNAPAPTEGLPPSPSGKPLMSHDEVVSRLKKYAEAKPLPFVAAELVQVTASSFAEVEHIKDVISRDPALTARILRTANSAFYGLHGRTDNLTHAVMRIGLRAIRDLAMAIAIVAENCEPRRPGGLNRMAFWQHSLGVAVLTRDLTVACGMNPDIVEQAFLAGLFHDLGKSMLDDCFPEEYTRVQANAANVVQPFTETERRVLDLDHAEAAKIMFRIWRLPEYLEGPASLHHHSWDGVISRVKQGEPLVGLVRIADVLCKAVQGAAGGIIEEIPDALCNALNLDSVKAAAAVEKVESQVAELSQIFLLHGSGSGDFASLAGQVAKTGTLVAFLRENSPRIDAVTTLLRHGFGYELAASTDINDTADLFRAKMVVIVSGSEDWTQRLTEHVRRLFRDHAGPAPRIVMLETSPLPTGIRGLLEEIKSEVLAPPYSVAALNRAMCGIMNNGASRQKNTPVRKSG
jgi:HD-like signal output (HDOD) protein/DNA-binding NarL/FixJ family response regulator